MENTKVWWQSRTVWTGLVGAIFAALSGTGLIPAEFTSDSAVELILAVISVASIYFRVTATTAITK